MDQWWLRHVAQIVSLLACTSTELGFHMLIEQFHFSHILIEEFVLRLSHCKLSVLFNMRNYFSLQCYITTSVFLRYICPVSLCWLHMKKCQYLISHVRTEDSKLHWASSGHAISYELDLLWRSHRQLKCQHGWSTVSVCHCRNECEFCLIGLCHRQPKQGHTYVLYTEVERVRLKIWFPGRSQATFYDRCVIAVFLDKI